MKKFLVIFIGLILVAPAWAENETPETPAIAQFVSPTTASTQATATVSANAPKYDLKTITATDQEHIASTAYVKGAHNSALSAINYLSDHKQAQLRNDAVSPANVSNIVKTTLGTTSTADNESLASELAVATALADKQATLTSTNVVVDSNASSGPVITGVSAAAGVVTVSKGEVTIPVGAASGANVTSHAQIWIQ